MKKKKKNQRQHFFGKHLQADWLEFHDYGELECTDREPKIILGYLYSP